MADEFVQNYPTISPEKTNLRMVLEKADYVFPNRLVNKIEDTNRDKYFSREEIRAGLRLDYKETNPQATDDELKSSVNFQMKKIDAVMDDLKYYNGVPLYRLKLQPTRWW